MITVRRLRTSSRFTPHDVQRCQAVPCLVAYETLDVVGEDDVRTRRGSAQWLRGNDRRLISRGGVHNTRDRRLRRIRASRAVIGREPFEGEVVVVDGDGVGDVEVDGRVICSSFLGAPDDDDDEDNEQTEVDYTGCALRRFRLIASFSRAKASGDGLLMPSSQRAIVVTVTRVALASSA